MGRIESNRFALIYDRLIGLLQFRPDFATAVVSIGVSGIESNCDVVIGECFV